MASTELKHSIRVPRVYKSAAFIAQKVKEEGGSLKGLLYNSPQSRFQNIKAVYALALTALQNYQSLEVLLTKSNILKKEKGLNPWLARILLTELLWRKKKLSGNCKPVTTILNYQKKFMKILEGVEEPEKEAIKKPVFVRVNTLKMTVEEVLDKFIAEGWNLIHTPQEYEDFLQEISLLQEDSFIKDWHLPEIFIFPPKTDLHNNELLISGSILIQDKASCFVVHALAPSPGSVVLDMCAAPGLKTSNFAALMRNEGKIYAVDIDPERFKTLQEQVEKLNCSCVETIHDDVLKLNPKDFEDIKYINLDVPCTGSGIVNRYDFPFKSKDPDRVNSLHRLQCKLLKYAMQNFPSVKKIIYSTCSVYEEENEAVIADILASEVSSEFALTKIKALKGKNISSGLEHYEFSKKCYRLEPEKHMTNGFFIAMFKRIKSSIKEDQDGEQERLENMEREN